MTLPSIAVLDDYQRVALSSADWSGLASRARVEAFHEPWSSEDDAAQALAPFDVVVLMRERTPFPASLIDRLPRLRLIALTGTRSNTLDIEACTRRGILISHTTTNPSTATAELAIALMLACARGLRQAFDNMAHGRWQSGVAMGMPLAGKRLGVVGLGLLGREVARIGLALRMDVVAWSQNMTAEAAAAQGVRRVEKQELFATSDVVSLHVALSARTRQVVGAGEIEAMKPGAILINTARAGLVDSQSLLAALQAGRISAGLDVYDTEPLSTGHVLRTLPNVVLTPHLGYVVGDVFSYYYRDIVENIDAWLAGRPIRILNPDAVRSAT